MAELAMEGYVVYFAMVTVLASGAMWVGQEGCILVTCRGMAWCWWK